jgi:restriction system protein
MVLSASKYPESFPAEAVVDYIPETRMVVVEYSLPDISALPTVKEVKYVATRDDLQEVHVTEAWLNREYDLVLYQVALRSLYELFQADAGAAIDSIVFNGWVNSIDKATGKEVNACVLSIATSKAEFMAINLANVDPKACFKKLKGVSAAKLTALQPVRPILQLNKEDKRFIPAYDVAGALDSSSNLAAMDWEDFEHLIRQLFEEMFSADGGEVKITQASRDGGVDAIVFDPDPIRGGKIVIQAKRYTNTVSVSAVRDLFGTIHNEGANKGILVTTADYGPDAYDFAKGKPITLISGSELLYLLNKHGHKARIDLKEARLLAAEAETLSHRPVQWRKVTGAGRLAHLPHPWRFEERCSLRLFAPALWTLTGAHTSVDHRPSPAPHKPRQVLSPSNPKFHSHFGIPAHTFPTSSLTSRSIFAHHSYTAYI